MRFVSATWWDLMGRFAKESGQELEAALISVDGRRVPAGKDFDPSTGRLKNNELVLLDEKAARELAQRIRSGEFRVTKVEDKPYTTRPYPPFTTSTLQQEANRKLNFTARRTMQVAQSLYENGHITYMRTDSTNLATVAVEDSRRLVAEEYGSDYLPTEPRLYKSKVKNAQEAHEAIRPAGHPFELPESLRSTLNADEFKLFDLIWKRTIASQMADARGRRIVITIEGCGCNFQVSGKTIDFPGYLRAYVEGSDDPDAELADQERVLPSVDEGEVLRCVEIGAKDHTTQPPGRYSEASLTKALEERGIGRPSTYASIIDTIQERKYVFKKGGALVPTWVAFSVTQLMEEHLGRLVDYQFTAQMEDDLDAISRGEQAHVDYLHAFYFGDGSPGLKRQLEHKVDEIDARGISRIHIGTPEGDKPVYVRVGKYSPFLEQGDRTASLPEDTPPDEVTLESALAMLEQAQKGDEPLGTCPETGKPVFIKVGRFGPYVQRGTADQDEKPQNASLLRGMSPESVDLETAVKLLSLPRRLGDHPELGQPVFAFNGRYGPYIKCGEDTRSLPADVSPLDVDLPQAVEILKQPKTRGRGTSAKREPIKVFDPSPVTGKPIQLLEGRYGPYVTDGETNASLPKSTNPDELAFDEALGLLAERKAKGPVTKGKRLGTPLPRRRPRRPRQKRKRPPNGRMPSLPKRNSRRDLL
jgi:DNA topoisomerase-1